jgi:D-alanine-D-alanine ligase
MADKLNILVLAGGISEEREVSLVTAKAVSESLLRGGHKVSVIDTASGGPLLDHEGRFLLSEDIHSDSKIALKSNESLILAKSLSSEQYRDCDLVFIALHGGSGENGTIQAILDLAGMKYTGSGMLASALAMNKSITKKIALSEGILTPGWRVISKKPEFDVDRTVTSVLNEFGLPLIVKPNDSGSTVGLSLVNEVNDLKPALEVAFNVSAEVMVEEFIAGREITCSVLDGKPLPLIEIIPTNELYDYECKYTKGKTEYICPADIPDKIAQLISFQSTKIYNAINCSGLARVDFRLDGRSQPYFLEVNTIPGMTELSLAPMAAKEIGIDFDQLIEKICRLTLKS